MMDDSISRRMAIDALQKEINKGIPPFNDVFGSIRFGVRLARDIIEDLPSVQPEIIRCGDCKYFKVEHGWNCASYPICEVSPQRIITPDDYCSFAERRTNENSDF